MRFLRLSASFNNPWINRIASISIKCRTSYSGVRPTPPSGHWDKRPLEVRDPGAVLGVARPVILLAGLGAVPGLTHGTPTFNSFNATREAAVPVHLKV